MGSSFGAIGPIAFVVRMPACGHPPSRHPSPPLGFREGIGPASESMRAPGSAPDHPVAR